MSQRVSWMYRSVDRQSAHYAFLPLAMAEGQPQIFQLAAFAQAGGARASVRPPPPVICIKLTPPGAQ